MCCFLYDHALASLHIDVQRVDVEHVLTEPNHKTVLGGRVLKSEGPAGATEDPTQSRKAPRPC